MSTGNSVETEKLFQEVCGDGEQIRCIASGKPDKLLNALIWTRAVGGFLGVIAIPLLLYTVAHTPESRAALHLIYALSIAAWFLPFKRPYTNAADYCVTSRRVLRLQRTDSGIMTRQMALQDVQPVLVAHRGDAGTIRLTARSPWIVGFDLQCIPDARAVYECILEARGSANIGTQPPVRSAAEDVMAERLMRGEQVLWQAQSRFDRTQVFLAALGLLPIVVSPVADLFIRGHVTGPDHSAFWVEPPCCAAYARAFSRARKCIRATVYALTNRRIVTVRAANGDVEFADIDLARIAAYKLDDSSLRIYLSSRVSMVLTEVPDVNQLVLLLRREAPGIHAALEQSRKSYDEWLASLPQERRSEIVRRMAE